MVEDTEWYKFKFFNKIYYTGISKIVISKSHRLLEKNRRNHFALTLELGATHGQHLEFVEHTFDQYILSDLVLNEDLINRIDTSKNISVIKLDAHDLSCFKSNSIDRILMTCLLHHLSDVNLSLEQMLNILKPKTGVLDILLPNDPSLIWNLGRIILTIPKVIMSGKSWSEYWEYVNQEHINSIQTILKIIQLMQIRRNLIVNISRQPFNRAPDMFTSFYRVSISKLD